jgi:hypothetical protein
LEEKWVFGCGRRRERVADRRQLARLTELNNLLGSYS